jgi:hypothetical protein
LRGTAKQLASFVAVSLVVVATVVGVIDRVTRAGWDSPLLQNWSLVTQAAATAGLLFVGLARRSRSLLVVTFLMGLIFVEEAFHVLTWFNGIERRVGRRIATVTPLSADVAGWVVLYAGIAAVGLAFLAYAYWSAVVVERRVVRNFALLLAVGGLFGGVVSATAALVDPARLTFVEELGESFAYAVIAGYVAGLVYVAATPRLGGDPMRPSGNMPERTFR